ncbi:F0F1 ATP synthase subunit delta [Patescibacteria group bacterium]|nr:F0F1 ATP synthase subunit delta [Patescibacteria group bacterium]
MINSRTLAETAVILSQKSDAPKHIQAFIEYMNKNNLNGILPQVLDHIKRLSSKTSEEETLHIYSKYDLAKKDIDRIRTATGAHDAHVEQHIDNSVIGGFNATYKGYMYDGSLETQVIRLKTMLTR